MHFKNIPLAKLSFGLLGLGYSSLEQQGMKEGTFFLLLSIKIDYLSFQTFNASSNNKLQGLKRINHNQKPPPLQKSLKLNYLHFCLEQVT